MPKTITPVTNNTQAVIHDSDGKNAPLPGSAGKAVATVTVSGKTTSVHGQVAKTSVILDNPA
jgi:hypothetical protein